MQNRTVRSENKVTCEEEEDREEIVTITRCRAVFLNSGSVEANTLLIINTSKSYKLTKMQGKVSFEINLTKICFFMEL